jgi:hypothetical protein
MCEGRGGQDFPIEADVRSRNGDNDPDWPSQCSLQMRWSKAGQIHSAILGVAPHITFLTGRSYPASLPRDYYVMIPIPNPACE